MIFRKYFLTSIIVTLGLYFCLFFLIWKYQCFTIHQTWVELKFSSQSQNEFIQPNSLLTSCTELNWVESTSAYAQNYGTPFAMMHFVGKFVCLCLASTWNNWD